MRQPGDEGVAGASLTASNAMGGSGGRPGKRPRASGGGAAPPQQAGTSMHLRSAQKRLLAAEAAARTDSGVGSSQQLDRTDSCGGSADADAGLTTAAAAAAAGAQQPPEAQQSWQQAQVQQSQRQQPAAAPAAAAAWGDQPPPKRRRVMRAGVPAPLPSYELRTFDRASPPFRRVQGQGRRRARFWRSAAHRSRGSLPMAARLLRNAMLRRWHCCIYRRPRMGLLRKGGAATRARAGLPSPAAAWPCCPPSLTVCTCTCVFVCVQGRR